MCSAEAVEVAVFYLPKRLTGTLRCVATEVVKTVEIAANGEE